ncbi:hypothetical protein FH972_021300 [Carpinus fangiana]|uniref:Prenyltransferase alpha-alpha toroid domain-containing protein n=1 Tax=Carpinus fangiana TaxID=176857 RepID=A0A5N6KPC2_9ROSI|nr:hypothetical protein FH972_021300 [Carpinus fangiana]
MAEGGETDVRAVYIVLVLLTLFNLPHTLPETSSAARAAGHRTFQDGVGQYIRACQSFEGGLGCAPSTEAHGAYTFCGIAALCLLDPWQGPKGTIHKYLDFDALLQWVLWRQDDITGGLAGRTNKLVDNCYSHWIGGCWSLLESAIPESPELFNRSSLALYILACGQAPYGGLRDKPSHDSDAYHSCYGLAGLSATMYRWQYVDGQWLHTPITRGAADSPPDLRPLHPVYVVPMEEAMATEEYFKLRPLA